MQGGGDARLEQRPHGLKLLCQLGVGPATLLQEAAHGVQSLTTGEQVAAADQTGARAKECRD